MTTALLSKVALIQRSRRARRLPRQQPPIKLPAAEPPRNHHFQVQLGGAAVNRSRTFDTPRPSPRSAG